MKKQLFLLIWCIIAPTFIHALQQTKFLKRNHVLTEIDGHKHQASHVDCQQERALCEEESEKNTTTLPHFLSPFALQIRTIELPEENEIPLIFDNSQMSCIDYQLAGKSIAQLITGNGNVHFESQSPYHFSCMQPIKAALLTIIAHSLSNKSDITCSSFGFKGNRLNCTPESTLTVNGTAQLEVDETVQQQGKFHVAENVSLRTAYLENSGSITAHNAQLNIDRKWRNSGKTSVQEGLTVNALASFNTGLIEAQDLVLNTGLEISFLGICRAKNSKINALIGLNAASLSLPKLGFWRDIFTFSNLVKAGDCVLLPALGPIDRMFYLLAKASYSAPGMVKKATDLYAKVQNLSTHAGASEWISAMCDAKDVTVSAVQSMRTLKGLASDVHHHAQDDFVERKIPEGVDSTTKIKQFASAVKPNSRQLLHLAGTVLSHQERETVLDVQMGATLGVNGHSRNVGNIQGGASLFANTYTMETCYGMNVGEVEASDLTIHATQAYRNVGAHGRLGGNKVYLQAASFQGDKKSHITATDGTRIQAAALDNQGSVDGSLQVHFTGGAEQLKNIGQVNARGGSFHYQGPVHQNDTGKRLPTADELANGSGLWGNVVKVGSISIDADTSNVHFNEEHTMQHALAVKTKGSIQCAETLTSHQSLTFQAQGAVDLKNVDAAHDVHVAGAIINAQSTMERTIDGTNYHETHLPVHIQAGNAIHLHAAHDVTLKAVQTSSGAGGTRLIAGGTIADQALYTTYHTETNNAHESTKNTWTTAKVSHHTSTGRFIAQCGEKYAADAPVFDAQGIAIQAQGEVIMHDVHHTHAHASDSTHDGGWFGTSQTHHDQSSSSTSCGAVFQEDQHPTITSGTKITLTNPPADTAHLILKAGTVHILRGNNTSAASHADTTSNMFWHSEKSGAEEHQSFSALPPAGTLTIDAHEINIQQVRDQACEFVQQLQEEHGEKVALTFVDERNWHDGTSSQGPSQSLSAVVAIGVTLGTAGVASSIGASVAAASVGSKYAITTAILSKMTAATFSSLCKDAVLALMNNEGNIMKAAESLANTDTCKALAKDALTAGLMGGAHEALTKFGVKEISKAKTFTERCKLTLPREAAAAGIRTVMDTAFENTNTPEARTAILTRNGRALAAAVIGTRLTSEIGARYEKGTMSYGTHKALHGAVGAVSGAVRGSESGTIAAATAGALGAVVGEVTAEFCAPSKPTHVCHTDERTNYERNVSRAQKTAELVAATAALLSKQDVHIAHLTAATALENNFRASALKETQEEEEEDRSVFTKLDPEYWTCKKDYEHHITCLRECAAWLESCDTVSSRQELVLVRKELDYVKKREAHTNVLKNNPALFTEYNKQQTPPASEVKAPGNLESSSPSQDTLTQKPLHQLKPGEYIDSDGNYYHQVPRSSVGQTVIKTLRNSQGKYETLEVQCIQPLAQDENTRISNSNAIIQRLTNGEFLGGLTADQKRAQNANDPEAFDRATNKRKDFEIRKTFLPPHLQAHFQNLDPSQQSFWRSDEQFQDHLDNQKFNKRLRQCGPEEHKKLVGERIEARRQKAAAEAKKREEQILDDLSAAPTKAQQKEMAFRNALASSAILTAAVCESGGGGALAGFIAEGAVVAGGSTAVAIAAPVALAAGVAGGMIAYHAMNSGPETTVEKDVVPPSGGAEAPKEQVFKLPEIESTTNQLKPLNLGSTGRGEPKNLVEQLALKEIMSDPEKGFFIKLSKGMTDSRWPQADGWQKMRWLYEDAGNSVEIHYVGKWVGNILRAVDDFKFK